MCGGALYHHQQERHKVYFPNPYAALPVITRDQQQVLMPWGRRESQPGQLPLGGWARLDSIQAGKWEKYHPVPVKIPLLQFMEKSQHTGESCWYTLEAGTFVQGLMARSGNEQRLYVVTLANTDPGAVHHRHPRIVYQADSGARSNQ